MKPLPSLNLRYWPDPILKTKCKDVEHYHDLYPIWSTMVQIMIQNKGIGLSAPQVGLSERIFVMVEGKESHRTFVNPIIIGHSKEKVVGVEGCLSIPGIRSRILRYKSVTVEYDVTEDTRASRTYEDLQARCIQHEIDHLNGITIFDHAGSNIKRKLLLEKYSKLRR